MNSLLGWVPAYIDPNTGGMLFQILAAGFALISGLILVFARQIRSAFARLKRWVRDRLGHEEQQTDVDA